MKALHQPFQIYLLFSFIISCCTTIFLSRPLMVCLHWKLDYELNRNWDNLTTNHCELVANLAGNWWIIGGKHDVTWAKVCAVRFFQKITSNTLCLILKKNIKFSDTDKTIGTTLHIDRWKSMLCVGNSSVVKIYIIRPKPGPVAKNATPRPAGWESNPRPLDY